MPLLAMITDVGDELLKPIVLSVVSTNWTS